MPIEATPYNNIIPDELLIPKRNALSEFFDALLNSDNLYIAIQSILDAWDIWMSSIKYYFDVTNPASANLSSLMMNQWLFTEEGFLVFILGSLIAGIFAFYGNYSNNQVSYEFANTYWPYIRDCFKGLKWTFKGVRSSLLVGQLLTHQNYISFITPIGVGLGVAAAINRYCSRAMIEQRKTLQEQNDTFRKQVKSIRAGFQLVDDKFFKLSAQERKKFFVGTIVRNQNDINNYFWVDVEGECQLINLKEKEKKFLEKLEKELNNASQVTAPRINWNLYQKYYLEEGIAEGSDLYKAFAAKQQYFKQFSDLDAEFYQTLYQIPGFQTNASYSYITALTNGLLNAPYYFLGALTMVVVPESVFIYALTASIFFMVLNLFGEYYQEFEYQRRLKISEMKAKLAMNKRVMMIRINDADVLLHEENKNLSIKETLEFLKKKLIDKSSFSQVFQQLLDIYIQGHDKEFVVFDFKDMRLSLENLQFLSQFEKNYLRCLIDIQELKTEFKKNKEILTQKMVLDPYMTVFQGLKNGLHVYGAFNGLLMTISTISFLFHWTFPVYVLYFSLGFGFLTLLSCTLYTYMQVPSSDQVLTTHAKPEESLFAQTLYTKSLEEIVEDSCDIKPSPNLLISEQSEIFRQAVSGFKKGIKATQILQLYLSHFQCLDSDASAWTKMLYFSMGLIYLPFFALKGYKGLRRVGEGDYKKASLFFGVYDKNQPEGFKQGRSSSTNFPEDDAQEAAQIRLAAV